MFKILTIHTHKRCILCIFKAIKNFQEFMKKSILALAFLSFVVASCGGNEEPAETADPVMEEPVVTEEPTSEEAISDVAEVVIEGNDQMKYNLSEIKVKAGQTVRLTLKHVGKMKIEVMGHNWVLLKPEAVKEDFAMAAIQAKETGYIPEQYKDWIIAHTDMVGGGEQSTIEFTAPEKGSYSFICSFPGHYTFMNGTFIVE